MSLTPRDWQQIQGLQISSLCVLLPPLTPLLSQSEPALTALTFLLFLPIIRTSVQHIMITSETTTAISPTVSLILSWAPKNHSPQCRLSYFTKTHLRSIFPVESCHMAPRTYSKLLSRHPRPPSLTFLHTLPWIPHSMEFTLCSPASTPLKELFIYHSPLVIPSLLPIFWLASPGSYTCLHVEMEGMEQGLRHAKCMAYEWRKGNFPQWK